MKSQLDISNVSLLTSVYSQSWPAPDPNNTPRKGFTGSHRPKSSQRCFNNQVTTNQHKKPVSPRWNDVGKGVNNLYGTSPLSVSGMRTGEKNNHAGKNEGIIRSTDLPLHLGLDKGTLQWKSWSSFKHDLEKHDSDDDLSLYKLTQDTFRKLTQQVNKASLDLNGRYSSTGFRGVRRSQLAASLPASQPSIQDHKEGDGEMEQFQSTLAIQCTPFKEAKPKRPKSHLVTSQRQRLSPPQRPHSSIGTVSHSDVNRFDQLSPNIIRLLKSEADSDGDEDTDLGPYDIINDDFKLDESDLEDSDELQTFETDEIDDDGPERRSLVAASMEMDSSEDEEQLQQRIQRVRKQRDKMRKRLMKMDLPPEVMSGDLECMFSYRASSAGKKKKQDPFPEALSEPYCHMDLLELSMLDKDWRTIIRTAPDEDDAALMERMIEMEKLQFETAEWESQQGLPKRRVASALQTKKGWNADAAIPTERAHSALAKPKQSKNCCEDCLQVVCAGDCPNKNAPANGKCVRCHQPYCNGSCTEFGYHMHIRQPRVEEKVRRRPKSCHTCRRKTTTQSVVNTNNVIMGRPRSGFATYSSSRVQSAKSRKMTVASSAGAEHISERMEKLGLSARKYKEKSEDEDGSGDGGKKRRPRTAGLGRQIRGRDALISGKSYQSQRRFSLTEEIVSTTAASMNPKRLRVRSAHYRTRKARQKHRKGKRK